MFLDLAGLQMQSIEGAKMGFTGKQVIHPDQISVVNEAFSPSQEKIQWARDLIAEFEGHQATGKVKLRVLFTLKNVYNFLWARLHALSRGGGGARMPRRKDYGQLIPCGRRKSKISKRLSMCDIFLANRLLKL